MKQNREGNIDRNVANERGRAHLRAIQSEGLTSLQLALQEQEKAIPLGAASDQVIRMRASLKERLGEQLERVLLAIRSMAESSVPHIRKLYEEVLRKRVFTEKNIKALAEVAKTSWKVLRTLFSWLREMCQRRQGAVGAVTGGILGLKAGGFVAGLLASIPFIGTKLAGFAVLAGIVAGAYYGYRVAMSLHDHWFRAEVVSRQADMQEQLNDIRAFLKSKKLTIV